MNIQKAIDRLKQLWKAQDDDYPDWWELEQILIALQEPEDDKPISPYPQEAGYIKHQIYIMNKRMSEIESKLGGEKKKRIDKIEERIQNAVDRLARLEDAHIKDGEFIMNALEKRGIVIRKPEPSSVSECKHEPMPLEQRRECVPDHITDIIMREREKFDSDNRSVRELAQDIVLLIQPYLTKDLPEPKPTTTPVCSLCEGDGEVDVVSPEPKEEYEEG
jgi:hypothetical protein